MRFITFFLLGACKAPETPSPDAESDTDADSDTDTDADTDTDTDADADTDSDTDADPGPIDHDGDGYALDDCDDTDAAVHPGANEACNGIDDDCSGVADDGLTFADYFPDADGDGFGDGNAAATVACAPPADMVPNSEDCDDTNAERSPALQEICNDVDDDCNSLVDDGLPTLPYWPDDDGDGFGQAVSALYACAAPTGFADQSADCDDSDPERHPGVFDDCNGVDDNCSGTPDDDATFVDYWPDDDGDGFHDGTGTPQSTCDGAPAGWVAAPGDCDDSDADKNPDITAPQCDFDDVDCDGSANAPTVPDDFSSIGTASAFGSIVCLRAGTHVESASIGSTLLIGEDWSTTIIEADGGAGLSTSSGASVRDVTVRGGQSSSTGAGISGSGDLQLHRVRIEGSTCTGTTFCFGTGLQVTGSGSVELIDVDIVDSSATAPALAGTGAFLAADSIVVDGLRIENTSASGAPGQGYQRGIGLHLDATSIDLTDVTVLDTSLTDTAGVEGIAIHIGGNGGNGATDSAIATRLDVRGVTATGVEDARGGGIYLKVPTTLNNAIITGVSVEAENLQEGAGLFAGHDSIVRQVTIVGNHFGGRGTTRGVGVFATQGRTLVLENATIDFNTHGGSAAGIHAAGAVQPRWVNAYSNSGDNWSGMADPTGTDGNISTDPAFVSWPSPPLTADLRLDGSSPLLDAGDPGTTDVDGTRSDIGAYGGIDGAW